MHRTKSGKEFPVEVSIFYVSYGDKELACCVTRDITERKLAESDLRKAHEELENRVEERTQELSQAVSALKKEITERQQAEAVLSERGAQFRHAHHLARLGYWSLDLDSYIIQISSELAEILGVPFEEVKSSPYAEFFDRFVHPDDKERVEELEEIPAELGAKYEIEYRIVRGDGEVRWIQEFGETIEIGDDGKLGEVGVVQDITEQRVASDQLRQSQKMRAVGQLTGGVAHDFNNLLAVILGNAELLKDKLGADNTLVQGVLQAATRGSELTKQLLAFSRRQSLSPQSIDLGDLAAKMLLIPEAHLGRDHRSRTLN